MDQFPIAALTPSSWRWDIAGAVLSGGQPVSGPPQTADAACGGWWIFEMDVTLFDVAQHKVWRAIFGKLKTANSKIAVPVLDAGQPWPSGVSGDAGARFSDDTTFSDGSLFGSDSIDATLAANAYAPAYPSPAAPPTQAQITLTTGKPLEGGEYFSVTGTSGDPRLHLVTRVLAVAGDVYTVEVTPPFREDYASGTRCEFDSPLCAMKLDIGSIGNILPALSPGFVGKASVRFVETFS